MRCDGVNVVNAEHKPNKIILRKKYSQKKNRIKKEN